ncbi:MAG: PorT family protein [Clostridia bacterium]|nr:PorT family protein [Clostridia bacterium]
MRNLKKVIAILVMALFTTSASAQVLISLLFGEALNTPKIEFGLAGGMSRSYINDISDSEGLNAFDLGFYFHINLMENSYLSTGVRVKSSVGAKGMPTYPIGNADFDTLYQDGALTKKIPCFYVPILWQQRFNNRWYIEAGPTLGLIYKAKDIFDVSELDGELTYTKEVIDEYNRIDVGLSGGVGYKFSQEIKSMSVGVTYYYGLVDVSKNPNETIKNSAFYFFLKIPIGLKAKSESGS